MPIRCVYTDLDGTLLGRGASLLRDGEGRFSLSGARALEVCFRADVEAVPVSGRTRQMLHEDCRVMGLRSYVYELGGGVVLDGEDTPLAGAGAYERIEVSGAPQRLFEHFPGRLEYHEPWHQGRSVTHLLRGLVDLDDANALLSEDMELVDNGAITPKPSLPDVTEPHAYHLLPRGVSKAAGVAAHMRARGYAREECIAVGDSREDVEMADHVGRFFLVANAKASDPRAEVTEGGWGEGVYEAVMRSIAESRTAATAWS
jgi:hydroxymethylpyrimidine pyrophosphatase-like HAD family hydrolase